MKDLLLQLFAYVFALATPGGCSTKAYNLEPVREAITKRLGHLDGVAELAAQAAMGDM